MKEFIVKDEQGFCLRVKIWGCVTPSDLNAIEFIQESKNLNGGVDFSSTYQFFMTDAELKVLAEKLLT